jgi:catechol 2,3-dioxygenase-like lactoylglutathione lyase family enzyme
VTIWVSDVDASRRFYATVLAPLGHKVSRSSGHSADWMAFRVAQARQDRPVTRGLHIAFVSPSREEVDGFWHAGVMAGYASDGEPGVRPRYHDNYYGAFLIDPDGNSVEAVYHGRAREGDNVIDHLWLRVADLTATKRFYEAIAPALGLRIANERAERFHVTARDRSFALVRGKPRSRNVHLAFPLPDIATVGEFHRIALTAGYRDNGPPGERRNEPGYYGVFILDPDGNSIEGVHRTTAG